MCAAGRGFTLVEMLVVMTVVALLIALLLPAVKRSKQIAHQVRCAAHLKQIGVGMEAFASEHKDKYPRAGGTIAWGGIDFDTQLPGLPSWMEQVHPYIQSREVFAGCGTYPVRMEYHYFLGARAARIHAHHNDFNAPIYFDDIVRGRIRFPSAFVLSGDNTSKLLDSITFDADKDNYTQQCLGFSEIEDGVLRVPHHLGGLNVMFSDSHVGYFKQFDPAKMTHRYETMSAWLGSEGI